jgi:hypothetical protein
VSTTSHRKRIRAGPISDKEVNFRASQILWWAANGIPSSAMPGEIDPVRLPLGRELREKLLQQAREIEERIHGCYPSNPTNRIRSNPLRGNNG